MTPDGTAQPTFTDVAFANAQFDEQFIRAIDTIPYGGADFGEAYLAAKRIGDEDREAWYSQWQALGDRIVADGERSLAAGRVVSARESFLRAATYHRTAGVFLIAPPLDDRLRLAHAKQSDAFRRASALLDDTVLATTIVVDGHDLDAYFLVPPGAGPFPALILVGGYDGTMEETYFAGGAAALRRGYAVLLMDGPGQGGALIEKGLHFRTDWEAVVGPEIDWLLSRPEVDGTRIAALGRSWGGFLAPRAAAVEHRLAAVIADAPQYAPGAGARFLLPPELRDRFDDGDPAVLNAALRAGMEASADLAFMLNRGMLTHGFDTPLDYLRGAAAFSLEGIAGDIACPVLLTTGESDPRNRDAQNLFDALVAPKEYIRFTEAEGGGKHDEAGAATLFSQRAFDWLDATLGR